ncbi:MAG: sensor histidine kinase [Solirubrobacterales bacterium]
MRRASSFFRASAFRLTLLYVGLFGASVLALLLLIYWSTSQALLSHIDETIADETEMLLQARQTEGLDGLIDAVRELTDPARPGRGVYAIVDPDGKPLAGNIEHLPPEARAPGWHTLLVTMDEDQHKLRARVDAFPSGRTLLVGHLQDDLDDFQTLMAEAMAWALFATVLLGAGGGYLLGRKVLDRIDAIAEGAEAIRTGHLAHRMPLMGSGDEFDRLSATLNAMLDQIDQLMSGVQTVTNNIAHDLRSPLTRIRSDLERAVVRGGSVEELKGVCESALAEADGLLVTFNALLSIAEAEAGMGVINPALVDVGALVQDVGELYGVLAADRGLDLTARPAVGLQVHGNRELLFQALSNLVDNAIKYTPAPGRIEVAVEADTQGISLTVADTGPGIPAADRERVLQRFTRLDQSRTTPGNGLGLSLVAAIVRLHGASLELGDNHPGLVVAIRFRSARPD